MSAAWLELVCSDCGDLFVAFNRGGLDTEAPLCGHCRNDNSKWLAITEDFIGRDTLKRKKEAEVADA